MVKLFLYAFVMLALAGCGARPALATGDEAELLPTLLWSALLDVQGTGKQPFDDPQCKAVVLIFFMQDCPIANSYVPEINRLHEEYEPRGVAILVVQVDPRITVQQAAEHQREYGLKPPVIRDPEHRLVGIAKATRTPEAAVFSRERKLLYRGRIDDRYLAVGKKRPEATKHDLANALEAIALGKAVSQATTEAVGCYIPELTKEK